MEGWKKGRREERIEDGRDNAMGGRNNQAKKESGNV